MKHNYAWYSSGSWGIFYFAPLLFLKKTSWVHLNMFRLKAQNQSVWYSFSQGERRRKNQQWSQWHGKPIKWLLIKMSVQPGSTKFPEIFFLVWHSPQGRCLRDLEVERKLFCSTCTWLLICWLTLTWSSSWVCHCFLPLVFLQLLRLQSLACVFSSVTETFCRTLDLFTVDCNLLPQV